MTQNSNIRGQGLRSERRTTGLGFVWKTASRSCSSYKRVITRIEPFGLPGRGVQEEGRPPPGAFLQVFRGIVPQAMLESLLGLSLLTSSRMGFLVSCEHMLSARCCQVKELRGLTDGCGRRRGSMDPRTRSVIATSPPPSAGGGRGWGGFIPAVVVALTWPKPGCEDEKQGLWASLIKPLIRDRQNLIRPGSLIEGFQVGTQPRLPTIQDI